MNPSIRKEIEDSANPACNREVAPVTTGGYCIITGHPSMGVLDIEYGFNTIAEAELALESMSIVPEDSDVDIEIELGSDVFDTPTDSELLAQDRDVPSKVVLGPCLADGRNPLMRLVKS